ncbi:hypothetical protein ACFVHQ_13390 [Actinomycetes bacterium NPDC127524]
MEHLKPYVRRVEEFRESGGFEEYPDIDTLLELLEEGLTRQKKMIDEIKKSEVFSELDLKTRKELDFQKKSVIEKLDNIDNDDYYPETFDVKTDIEQIIKLYKEKDKNAAFSE